MPDHTMNYLECDIPAGLTIAEWRRARLDSRRPRGGPARRLRLRRRHRPA